MKEENFTILLADDDPDDRMFFEDALDELLIRATLHTVSNGVELMKFLENNAHQLPSVLFLDLNMPSKSGAECLSEIKNHEKFSQVPIIIYSTSANPDVMELLYNMGAQYYVRKEGDFSNLKSVISKALALCQQSSMTQPPRKNFLILL
ncbi:response regulator [Algoriphagus terrigena]|uniref:response regulator n=1 Tax=Algoriphagus terrigena TaxID=344884 RepID=UPI00047E0EAC|nr:response regulator [Algoriphagus terrigena]